MPNVFGSFLGAIPLVCGSLHSIKSILNEGLPSNFINATFLAKPGSGICNVL